MRLPRGIVVAPLAALLTSAAAAEFMEDLDEAVGLAREQAGAGAADASGQDAAPASAQETESPAPEPPPVTDEPKEAAPDGG